MRTDSNATSYQYVQSYIVVRCSNLQISQKCYYDMITQNGKIHLLRVNGCDNANGSDLCRSCITGIEKRIRESDEQNCINFIF